MSVLRTLEGLQMPLMQVALPDGVHAIAQASRIRGRVWLKFCTAGWSVSGALACRVDVGSGIVGQAAEHCKVHVQSADAESYRTNRSVSAAQVRQQRRAQRQGGWAQQPVGYSSGTSCKITCEAV